MSETAVADRRQNRGRSWLLLAIGLFMLQVLPFFSYRWVTDESWYAGPAYSIAHGHGVADPAIGPNDIENHFDARPPGMATLISVFFRLLGTGQVAARLGSFFAGIVVMLLVYRMARSALGDEAAVLAALLVATDTYLALASRSARPEALTTLAITSAFFAMLRYRTGGTMWAPVSGLLIALGAMFHVSVLGYVVSLGIFAILFDRRRGGTGLLGAATYTLGFLAGVVPFCVWILTAPLGRAGFQAEYLSRALGEPLSAKFLEEIGRYSSFFGIYALHGHGLEYLPARLPVPLLLLIATLALWRYRREWFYLELILLLPTMLWFVDTANKSPRYLTIYAPAVALICGAGLAVIAQHRPDWRKSVLALGALAVVTQLAGNLVLLQAARKADYTTLGAKLRSVVPPGETVYGTITFWLAFHDHPYISYERTDPLQAATQFHARYFIAGDRMMVSPSQTSAEEYQFYRTMNLHFREVTAGSTVVGHFVDPYYGDLTVYRIGDRPTLRE